MNLLAFLLDEELLLANQASLSDTIRMAFYQENEALFERLDYDNDTAFLEPTLFCYFLSDISKNDKIGLFQSVLGYIPTEKRPQTIVIKADKFGLINLPNLGYLRTKPNAQITIDVVHLLSQIEPNLFIENSKIRLNLHPTDLLAFQNGVTFYEATEQTLLKNKEALHKATRVFQTNMPEFWRIIEETTREFVVFSSPNYNSFAGIMQHGTAYFNTENKLQSPVFFIDDIAHQCGHVIYNALTLDTNRYLKVPKDEPLAGFTETLGETRDVYGALHGLFTYTCILYSLDQTLGLDFSPNLLHEAKGRMGFYLHKFEYDVRLMANDQILTEDGLRFVNQFAECYRYIYQKYSNEISCFSYENQPYMFQYDLFQTLNPINNT